jgi:hypothetical protein
MREAQDPAAAYAGAAFQQVHASAALVTIGCQLGVAEDAEFRHGRRDAPPSADPNGVVESKVIFIIPARARTFIIGILSLR